MHEPSQYASGDQGLAGRCGDRCFPPASDRLCRRALGAIERRERRDGPVHQRPRDAGEQPGGIDRGQCGADLRHDPPFDPGLESRLAEDVKTTSARISKGQESIEVMALSGDEKAQMEKIPSSRRAMIDVRNEAQKARSAGDSQGARKIVNERHLPDANAYLAALRGLVELEEATEQRFTAQMRDARSMTTQIAVAAMVVIVALICVGEGLLMRSIREPLRGTDALAAGIAGSDLSADIDTSRGDEFGGLMKSRYIAWTSRSRAWCSRFARAPTAMLTPARRSHRANRICPRVPSRPRATCRRRPRRWSSSPAPCGAARARPGKHRSWRPALPLRRNGVIRSFRRSSVPWTKSRPAARRLQTSSV